MTDLNQEFGSVPPPREDDIDRQPEHVAEVIDGLPREDPPPELVTALQLHYARKREALTDQIQAMEDLLGFIEVSGNLATRVAKLEAFLGIKG